MAQENARLALERKFEPARLNQAVLEGLQAFLGLATCPRRIECFDISHGQGREVVATCVVFSDGVPDKAALPPLQDDQRAERRLRQHVRGGDAPLQSACGTKGRSSRICVLIDGGLGQLHAAEAALKELGLEQLELGSLAKKEELVFRPGLQRTPEHPEDLAGAAAAPAHPRRSPPLRHHLPPGPAGQAHPPDRADPDPRHRPGHRQEAAPGLRQRHPGARGRRGGPGGGHRQGRRRQGAGLAERPGTAEATSPPPPAG